MRLTDPFIKSLQAPESGAVVYSDDGFAGFGVRVSEGGTKSYVLTHGKLRRRETIGRVGTITLAKAREKAKIRLAEYTLGKSEGASMGWAEAVQAFLNDVKRRLKPRTLDGYTYELTKALPLRRSEARRDQARRHPAALDRIAHSPVQQHRAFVTLGTFMKWAYRRHYVETNPMDRMVSGHRYRPRMRFLSDDELVAVWKACPEDDFGTIVKTLILTGQRVGEITNLSPDMIGTDTVTLPDWLVKNSHAHTFPVGALVLEHIKRLPMRKNGERSTARFENYQRHKARLDAASGYHRLDPPRSAPDLRIWACEPRSAVARHRETLEHVSGSFAVS